jgi:hypothetical protein
MDIFGNVWKSTSSASSWTPQFTRSGSSFNVYGLTVSPFDNSKVFGAAYCAGSSDCPGVIGTGADGVVRVLDSGITGQPVGHLAVQPGSDNPLFAAVGSSVLQFGTSSGAWATFGTGLPAGSLINDVAVDNAFTVWATSGLTVYQAPVNGGAWTTGTSQPPNAGLYDLRVQPSGGQLYVRGYTTASVPTLWRFKGGGSWQQVSNYPPGANIISPFSLGSASNLIIMSGDSGASVYSSVSQGAFNKVSAYPTGTSITDLAVAPNDSNTWYVAAGSIYVTNDGGASFKAPRAAPDGCGMYAIAVDPKASATVWVATNCALFKSIDGGTTWTKSFSGLFRASAYDSRSFAFGSTSGLLYLGTDLGGVFQTVTGGF